MNPSSSEMPGMQLPQPVEQAEQQIPRPEAGLPVEAVETATVSAPERSASVASAPPATIPLPVPSSAPSASPPPAMPIPSVGTPAVADDTDLIEKEWVAKAKQIVAQTRDNPYQQSKELTVFKADYMQKRYNKTIKLGE